jgi:hypothetical protein
MLKKVCRGIGHQDAVQESLISRIVSRQVQDNPLIPGVVRKRSANLISYAIGRTQTRRLIKTDTVKKYDAHCCATSIIGCGTVE